MSAQMTERESRGAGRQRGAAWCRLVQPGAWVGAAQAGARGVRDRGEQPARAAEGRARGTTLGGRAPALRRETERCWPALLRPAVRRRPPCARTCRTQPQALLTNRAGVFAAANRCGGLRACSATCSLTATSAVRLAGGTQQAARSPACTRWGPRSCTLARPRGRRAWRRARWRSRSPPARPPGTGRAPGTCGPGSPARPPRQRRRRRGPAGRRSPVCKPAGAAPGCCAVRGYQLLNPAGARCLPSK